MKGDKTHHCFIIATTTNVCTHLEKRKFHIAIIYYCILAMNNGGIIGSSISYCVTSKIL